MKIEDLPEELRGLVEELKEGSSTIQCCVDDALGAAEDLEDFNESVSCEMLALIAEAQEVMNTLGKEVDDSKPEIIIVIQGGGIQTIATAGESKNVTVIDLDQKSVGEPCVQKYKTDAMTTDVEQCIQTMVED